MHCNLLSNPFFVDRAEISVSPPPALNTVVSELVELEFIV